MAVKPGTKQARGRARREAILEAAATLFATNGFRGTSIAAIAEKVGVTDAGVLYHFPTKTDLLLAVLAHFERLDADELAETYARGGYDLLLALRDLGAQMERTPDLTALGLTLSAEHLQDDSVVNTYFRERYAVLRAFFEEAITDAIDSGHVRPDVDAASEASALIAHLDGIRFQWFFSGGAVSMDQSVRTYTDAMLARVRADVDNTRSPRAGRATARPGI